MNLIDSIEQEMLSDSEDRADQSARLLDLWHKADPASRDALDAAFICLCGYSLSRMVERADPA